MIKVIHLNGKDPYLYELVAPLVMDPAVLKQNNNYPFRTSEKFVWFIALDDEAEGNQVVGFIPLEYRRLELIVNNYYVAGKQADVLNSLLEAVIAKTEEDGERGRRMLTAVVLSPDRALFEQAGFTVFKEWRRYLKMVKTD